MSDREEAAKVWRAFLEAINAGAAQETDGASPGASDLRQAYKAKGIPDKRIDELMQVYKTKQDELMPRKLEGGRLSKNIDDRRERDPWRDRIEANHPIRETKGDKEPVRQRLDTLHNLMRPKMIEATVEPQSWDPSLLNPQVQTDQHFEHGLLRSDAGGRTDRLPITVAPDSYVIPADIVSGLGQGNTDAGDKLLQQLFQDEEPLRKAHGGGVGHQSRVPVVVAGGEWVIKPQVVAQKGGGDMSRGHARLDKFVRSMRKQIAQQMMRLPGPKKD